MIGNINIGGLTANPMQTSISRAINEVGMIEDLCLRLEKSFAFARTFDRNGNIIEAPKAGYFVPFPVPYNVWQNAMQGTDGATTSKVEYVCSVREAVMLVMRTNAYGQLYIHSQYNESEKCYHQEFGYIIPDINDVVLFLEENDLDCYYDMRTYQKVCLSDEEQKRKLNAAQELQPDSPVPTESAE